MRWRLFRVFGIPISIDASWLVILALFTWILAQDFRATLAGLAPIDYWVMGLGVALAFFLCILLHEVGHSLVARALGIPISGITLFLFGGVSEMEDEPPSARSEFLMAIAGPAVTAILWALLDFWAEIAQQPTVMVPVARLAQINFLVLAFNVVPAFPLDGGRVLRAILWWLTGSLTRATYWAALCGRVFAWLLIGLGVYFLFMGLIIPAIWLGVTGLFLNTAAQGSYQQVLIRQALHGEPVSRFMNREPIVVPPNVDLLTWVDDYVYKYHRKLFPVAANGHVEGVISTKALASYPRRDWPQHTVGEAMSADTAGVRIAPDADALHALEQMQHTGASRLLVMDGDHLVGIVSLKDLLRFLNHKLHLEDARR